MYYSTLYQSHTQTYQPYRNTDKRKIMARVKYLYKEDGKRLGIRNYPNFHKSGSVFGMKKLYYGMNALLVRCGDYIYNVSSEPAIYNAAH